MAEAEGLVDRVADEVDDDRGNSEAAPQSIEQEGVNDELAQADAPAFDADSEGVVQAPTTSVDELRTTAPADDELQATEVPDGPANDDTITTKPEPAAALAATAIVQPSMQPIASVGKESIFQK